MKSDDPYTPVRVPAHPAAARNRPYYIYATAVVMLLWAAIYICVQSQTAASTDTEVTSTVHDHYTSRTYEFDVVTIAVLFAISLAVVNSTLWAILKIINR